MLFGEMLSNRGSSVRYGDDVICGVLWWAVIHDRPVHWACREDNWPNEFVRRPLPSQPTMSRCLRSSAVELLLDDVESACG